MNRCATVVFFIAVLGCVLPATAAITATGSIDPTYDATDPWNVSGSLVVGSTADANMVISGGSQVVSTDGTVAESAASNASVLVTGSGSLWQVDEGLYVGLDGQGALTLSDGGRVDANYIRIAHGDSTLSQVVVAGAGSLLNLTYYVAVGGNGILDVNGGGQITSTEGPVNGQVRISGSGSSWTNSGFLGLWNNTDVVISDGGRLTTQSSRLHASDDWTSSVVVTGSGSLWESQTELDIASMHGGDISLLISDGGQVTCDSATVEAQGDGEGNALGTAVVTVTGTGSRWTIADSLTVGDYFYTGPAAIWDPEGFATINVSDGGVVEANDITVWEGSVLAGDGMFRATEITNHGIIRPGNSIGTLTFDGDLVMDSNSVLEIEIDNDGNSDKLIVTGQFTPGYHNFMTIGTETITGLHVYRVVDANSVAWPAGQSIDSYRTALLHSSFVSASGSEPNIVALRVTALSFEDAGVARTDNQKSLGAALDIIAAAGGNDTTTMLQQIVSDDDVRTAYDQLSGQTRVPLAYATIATGTRPMETVAGRMRDASRASSPSGVADLDSDRGLYSFAFGNGTSYLSEEQWGIWGKFFGLYGDRDADGAEMGYEYSAYGGGFGMDYQFSDRWLFGATGGYWDGDVTFDSSADSTAITSTYGGLYASFETSRWYADAALTYSNLSYESTRYVDLLGEQLEGEFDGTLFGGYIEAGINWWYQADCLIQPLASLQVASVDIDGYTESGGTTSLQYESEQYTSTRSGLGAKVVKSLFLDFDEDIPVDVEVRGRWLHEFGDAQSSVAVQFADTPTASFRISDPQVSRDSALLGAGLRARLGDATRLFVDYDTELSSDRNVQIFSAGLEYRW